MLTRLEIHLRSVSLPLRIAAVLGFMALLVAASLIPGNARPGDSTFTWVVANTPTVLQKVLHVGLYAVLTLLIAWTLEGVPRTTRMVIAAGAAVTFGAVMEWLQIFVPGRFSTLLDVFLNALGAVLGVLAAMILL